MEKGATFDPSSFDRLKRAENSYFWFYVRRMWIFDKIRQLVSPPADLLEVGCGTGNVSSFLSKKGYNVTGCEYFQDAIDMAWPGFKVVKGDATNLPFENNTFDIVGLFDVIEHFDDEMAPLKEAVRVTRNSGIIAITVPAREELWSCVDERAFHKRRYTKEALKNMLQRAGLAVESVEYMFMSLYLPMKILRKNKNAPSDEFAVAPLINLFLRQLFNIERYISKVISLPIGTSLIAIARKY